MAEVEAVRSSDLLGQVFSRIIRGSNFSNQILQPLTEDSGCQVFPAHVTEQLLDGEKMVAESHECDLTHPFNICTVNFSLKFANVLDQVCHNPLFGHR
jgi:hypothetical protein